MLFIYIYMIYKLYLEQQTSLDYKIKMWLVSDKEAIQHIIDLRPGSVAGRKRLRRNKICSYRLLGIAFP